jgi:hypothetical protein
MNQPGRPGGVYMPNSLSDIQSVIKIIRQRGAEVDLTSKGRAAGVWDADKGFCLQGHWQVTGIDGWTAPAADSHGNMTTHVTANISFAATHLGRANDGINPLGLTSEATRTYDAVLYNDGWRIVTDGGDAAPPPQASTSHSGGLFDGLFGWLVEHHLMSGGDHDSDSASDASKDGDSPSGDDSENSSKNDDETSPSEDSHSEESGSNESNSNESRSSSSSSSSGGPD